MDDKLFEHLWTLGPGLLGLVGILLTYRKVTHVETKVDGRLDRTIAAMESVSAALIKLAGTGGDARGDVTTELAKAHAIVTEAREEVRLPQ